MFSVAVYIQRICTEQLRSLWRDVSEISCRGTINYQNVPLTYLPDVEEGSGWSEWVLALALALVLLEENESQKELKHDATDATDD
jgi:hypothetical protein